MSGNSVNFGNFFKFMNTYKLHFKKCTKEYIQLLLVYCIYSITLTRVSPTGRVLVKPKTPVIL